MKCWIASFPRSGNTYFRNILYDVYGIPSSTWHKESLYPVEENYDDYEFVKTHLLPKEIEPSDPGIPAVYLVRDGRDAMVSIAHHRKDIVEPGTDFLQNLKEAIIASEGSYFGGWSTNVNAWIERATIIIKYEDLVDNPRREFERLEAIIDMPKGDWSRLPTFDKLKFGSPKYGGSSTSEAIKIKPQEFSQRFFRKGKAGAWNEEMPHEMQQLFMQMHGDVMERLGYIHQGQQPQHYWLDGKAMTKMGLKTKANFERSKAYRVLIEGSKLQITKSDGVKRYLISLLKGLDDIQRCGSDVWHFDLLINRKIIPVSDFIHHIRSEVDDIQPYEQKLLQVKSTIKHVLHENLYEALARLYRKSPARALLRSLRQQALKKDTDAFLEMYKNSPVGYDLIHLPLPQHIDLVKDLNTPVVVTVHDLTHKTSESQHTEENIKLAEKGFQFLNGDKAGVIAISEHTRQDLLEHFSMANDRINVVYQYADPSLFYPVNDAGRLQHVRMKYNLPDSPYFLCLSTIEPRKNLVNTIKGFTLFKQKHKDSQVKLFIGGSMGWKPEEIKNAMKTVGDDIMMTGFIEDKDLAALYSGAIAFCYLSTYEGFGLPPLEAMSCKKVVIHSGLTSLKEVVGDTGLVADPFDTNDISVQFEKAYFQHALIDDLSQKSYNRALQFNRRRFLMETLEAYKNNMP